MNPNLRQHKSRACLCVSLCVLGLWGCSPLRRGVLSDTVHSLGEGPQTASRHRSNPSAIRQVSGESTPPASSANAAAPQTPPRTLDDDLFAGQTTLTVDELVRQVEQRNPNIQAMYAAWQAAAARYPQEVSLDDAMIDAMVAPGSLAAGSNVPGSYAVEVSQKVPWFGKRGLRGHVANANASAAAFDAEDTRLQISLAARLAYVDYASNVQLMDLNTREKQLLDEIRSIAQVRYETNQATQQDVLQAAVELNELQVRRIELGRSKKVAVARINTLLHRHPRATLPPAEPLASTGEIPDPEALLNLAVQIRPDLASQAAKIAAEQSAICLALKEFYPDIDWYGRYDRFWFDREQRTSVGLRMNLPVRRSRRWAAVEEAQARLSKAQAEYEARVSQLRYEVEAARERAVAAEQVTALYSGEIARSAEQNVAAAQAGYVNGNVSFLALVQAQRQFIEFRRKAVESAAEYQRELAELERAVGGPVTVPEWVMTPETDTKAPPASP